VAILDALVSPYVGIVRSVEEVVGEPFDIRLPSLCCETGHLGPQQTGAGSGLDRDSARAAAIGEAVERYSACETDHLEAVVGSARELGARAVAPDRFALHSRAQHARPGFPYRPFTADTPVAWVPAFSLPDGAPVLLPAQLVFLHWKLREGEERIARSTSSGLACRPTLEEASLSGLLELLERDAFMLTWKARLSWPRVAWPSGSRLAAFEREFVAPTGLSVAALDLSAVWSVPTVLGVARSSVPGEAPLGVGAAAATSIESAATKAIDEAIRVRSWASALRALDPGGESLPPPEEIRTFEQHIQFYAYERHLAATRFLDASPERRAADGVEPLEGGTPSAQVRTLCERLSERGLTAYVADAAPPDVRTAGLCVARVVVPELCALDVEHAARYLGGVRLYKEPVRLGFCARPLTEDELNPDPHPFP